MRQGLSLDYLKKMGGFTLIELIMVLIILSTLAVFALPKLPHTSVFLEYEAQKILADIRYIQLRSMLRGERYRWVQISTSSYQILNQIGTPIVLPMGNTTHNLSNGVTFYGLFNLPNNLIAFGTDGMPYTTSSIPGTQLTTTGYIVLTTGSRYQIIVIYPYTGYGKLWF